MHAALFQLLKWWSKGRMLLAANMASATYDDSSTTHFTRTNRFISSTAGRLIRRCNTVIALAVVREAQKVWDSGWYVLLIAIAYRGYASQIPNGNKIIRTEGNLRHESIFLENRFPSSYSKLHAA